MPKSKAKPSGTATTLRHWLTNAALQVVIGAIKLLPYHARVPALGWVMRRVIGPVAQYRRRALQQLDYIWPDRDAGERRAIADAALDNVGRTFAENYSGPAFRARQAGLPLSGPGADQVLAALNAGEPVLFAAAHYGNYEALRARLLPHGITVGAMYRTASNPYFDRHYRAMLEEWQGPIYNSDARGTARFARDLKQGQAQAIMFDLYVAGAPPLPFLGQPAPSSVAAARMATKAGALLVPFYAVRQANGLDFEVTIEAPIAHSTIEDMTRALNASLEAQIRQEPGQWIWAHRRWKPGRKLRRNHVQRL